MGRKLKGRQIVGKGLKGALQNHMANEKLQNDRKKSLNLEKERRDNKSKSMKSGKQKKHNTQQAKTKSFVPFEYSDTLLLVGEGDFSYACSIVRQMLIDPKNLIASSFDSKEELISKYPAVDENLQYLIGEGVQVLHEVDATDLVTSLKLSHNKKKRSAQLFTPHKRLNHIMFNFPHTGRGMKDMDRNVRDHQKLVLGYFKSSQSLFQLVNDDTKNSLGGYDEIQPNTTQKILLSLFEGEPYISWGVKALARTQGLQVERSGSFDWSFYQGYHHKRTNGVRDTTKPAAERDARIYVFAKALTAEERKQLSQKKKADDSDDDN